MHRLAPWLYVSAAEPEWPRRPSLPCPPFGDARRLWHCRNSVVLNKLGVFGMFPTGCDWVTTGCVSGAVGLEEVSERRFCLVRALTSLSYFFAKGYVVGRGYLPFRGPGGGAIRPPGRPGAGDGLGEEKPAA